jgi:predicted dehydrogenase
MGSIAPTHSPQFLVIGAGSRGHSYARAVEASTGGTIAAVAEIDPFKRREFGRRYIWGTAEPLEGQSFGGWQEWVEWETRRREDAQKPGGVDPNDITVTGVFVCTLDDTHAPIVHALAPLGLHILCEKPLALSLADCLSISSALSAHPPKIVSIGHVLHYSPHNILLRKLLTADKVVGEVVSMEHTEPVGWWHFSHSYVRGNWRRATPEGVGSLLTKSCHDVDFILWLLGCPSPLVGDKPHLPSTISSTGAVTHFRRARKPKAAGPATNCLSCPAEPDCIYSAKKIYRDRFLRAEKDPGWPLKIVVPEIEDIVTSRGWDAAERKLMERLAEDYDRDTTPDDVVAGKPWYGRCVYEADNDVVDDQTVTIEWDDDKGYGRGPKRALFHMTYPTQAQCERRGRIYGTAGEMAYDSHSISVYTFADNKTVVHDVPKQAPEVEKSHGGGDWGLAGAFVRAVQSVDDGHMAVAQAQREFVGCDLQEIILSHAVVFAAEEARRDRRVVDWPTWSRENGLGR